MTEERSVSAVHSIGKKRASAGPRLVIVPFASRMQKQQFIRNRQKLCDNQRIKDDGKFGNRVTVADDLMPARRRILKVANENAKVEITFARDGTIHCKLKNQTFVQLENVDDLFKIGLDRINYANFIKFKC